MQGHGIQGVGQQGQDGYESQPLHEVNDAQQPEKSEPCDGNAPLQGLAQGNSCDSSKKKQDAIVHHEGFPTLPSVF